MSWSWRTGLLAQALSDYKLFLLLGQLPSDIDTSHWLHYLQMTTEKLAKGLLSDGVNPPPMTHKALQSFLKQAAGFKPLQDACGFRDDLAAFERHLRNFRDIAQKIEELAPQGVNAPNPEYPWEERRLDSGGAIRVDVHVPAKHNWTQWRTGQFEIATFLKFLQCCFQAVEKELSSN